MKRIARQTIAAVLLLSCTIGSHAQKLENDLFVSLGRFIEADTDTIGTTKGQTKKIGYGLNFYLTDNYSVMAAVVSHFDTEKSIFESAKYTFIDVPILFQYHTTNNGVGNLMLGCGPVISKCIHNDYYETDDSRHGLNHKKKIKEVNFSLMPCIAYEMQILRFQIDANIGLRDMKRQYKVRDTGDSLTPGQNHLHNVCFTLGIKL
ncbi:MAG: hypothetical protein J6T12_10465 [Salinivirgaceae bacterium]|nr:hypothetical protein [Salinivirgaceae bacterium]